jgi:glycerate kinase
VIAAPDKFRGSATAAEVAAAIAAGASEAGYTTRPIPLADGGEGTLDVFGGGNRTTTVTGPLGTPVDAPWRLDGTRAVIEMATASGLLLAGGTEHNDPVHATTRGTGELIAAAISAGATEIIVGVGGSATTDGGLGALEAIGGAERVLPDSVRLRVCADVTTRFTDAARVFGPQKGADEEVVRQLTDRLFALRDQYRQRYGVDVDDVPGSGAAGGLAGGLAAIGAVIRPGFQTLAEAAGLDNALAAADPATDLAITGEGRFDATSLAGKVVGGVLERARRLGLHVVVVAGSVDTAGLADGSVDGITVISLIDHYGADAAWNATTACIRRAVTVVLRDRHWRPWA